MHYDYIIAGAGCAGLSLLMRLMNAGLLKNKKVLLVDKAPKNGNDRTWCFWETADDIFEPVVYRCWNQLHFHTHAQSLLLSISPYRYKMIRAGDFYAYCFDKLSAHPGIDIRYGNVTAVWSTPGKGFLTLSGTTYTADYIFSSIMPDPFVKQAGRHYLVQHFQGWVIDTGTACFDTSAATIMDFRTQQQAGASFVYILPFSPTRAMVEYTLFSEKLLEKEVYNQKLKEYLQTFYPDISYTIREEEFGIIPMTNHRFPVSDGRIIYIGTAGGQTKPSSGYTFRFIQRHTQQLADSLLYKNIPCVSPVYSSRFQWYDTILLRVLADKKVQPDEVFGRLFEKNKPQRVLSFLDNTTSLAEDIALIASLPKWPFLNAAIKELKLT